jgi:hypothetical protein
MVPLEGAAGELSKNGVMTLGFHNLETNGTIRKCSSRAFPMNGHIIRF